MVEQVRAEEFRRRKDTKVITFACVAIFGTILVGFLLYHFVFSDNGRKGGKAEEVPQKSQGQTKGRATGLD
jgi:hypothetical protein